MLCHEKRRIINSDTDGLKSLINITNMAAIYSLWSN